MTLICLFIFCCTAYTATPQHLVYEEKSIPEDDSFLRLLPLSTITLLDQPITISSQSSGSEVIDAIIEASKYLCQQHNSFSETLHKSDLCASFQEVFQRHPTCWFHNFCNTRAYIASLFYEDPKCVRDHKTLIILFHIAEALMTSQQTSLLQILLQPSTPDGINLLKAIKEQDPFLLDELQGAHSFPTDTRIIYTQDPVLHPLIMAAAIFKQVHPLAFPVSLRFLPHFCAPYTHSMNGSAYLFYHCIGNIHKRAAYSSALNVIKNDCRSFISTVILSKIAQKDHFTAEEKLLAASVYAIKNVFDVKASSLQDLLSSIFSLNVHHLELVPQNAYKSISKKPDTFYTKIESVLSHFANGSLFIFDRLSPSDVCERNMYHTCQNWDIPFNWGDKFTLVHFKKLITEATKVIVKNASKRTCSTIIQYITEELNENTSHQNNIVFWISSENSGFSLPYAQHRENTLYLIFNILPYADFHHSSFEHEKIVFLYNLLALWHLAIPTFIPPWIERYSVSGLLESIVFSQKIHR